MGATLVLWISIGAGSWALVPFLTLRCYIDVAAMTGPEKASPGSYPDVDLDGRCLGYVESYVCVVSKTAPRSTVHSLLESHWLFLLILAMLILEPLQSLFPLFKLCFRSYLHTSIIYISPHRTCSRSSFVLCRHLALKAAQLSSLPSPPDLLFIYWKYTNFSYYTTYGFNLIYCLWPRRTGASIP